MNLNFYTKLITVGEFRTTLAGRGIKESRRLCSRWILGGMIFDDRTDMAKILNSARGGSNLPWWFSGAGSARGIDDLSLGWTPSRS